MEYQIIIGLEVHVQLLTRTKLFCGCRSEFGAEPNSQVCPVCLGLPGSLPVMNQRAFELALKTATALNCDIARFTKWDRKNYYYPDLPKSYQISQYDLPLSHDGYLDIGSDESDGNRRIGIIRAHLEEDAGKLVHASKTVSQVDLNRTGTPLLEIVSQPDIRNPAEAKAYLEELRLLLRYLEVSDCNMQEGSLRCDANINLHILQPDGAKIATPIVEVKNMNSFRAVERAMEFEARRQFDVWKETGEKLGDVPKATAGWDDERQETVIQRSKEEASDYRYFPDPDLVPVVVSDAEVDQIQAELGELPARRRARYRSDFQLSAYDTSVIIDQGKAYSNYFEELVQICRAPKQASNWMQQDVLRTLNERKLTISSFPIPAAELGVLLAKVEQGVINTTSARDVFAVMLETGSTAEAVIRERGLEQVSDEQTLRNLVIQILDENPKVVADFRKGKKQKQVEGFARGLVMKQTQGKANAKLVGELIAEELAKRA